MRTILHTPPVQCIVPPPIAPRVFDAFNWSASSELEWRRPDIWSKDQPLSSDNPPRMVFVMKMDLPFLPRELAHLHMPGIGLRDEWALAPYAIDDATDELWAHGMPPEGALWLATDSLRGLFWGLHDWAHFHSHGPFTERAWTELQCDVTALTWLRLNRQRIGLHEDDCERVEVAAQEIAHARFREEEIPWPEGFELRFARRLS